MKIFSVVLLMSLSAFAEAPKYKIKWALAHEPARVFEKAAKKFSEIVQKNSDGAIEVEIVHPAKNQPYDVVEQVQKGDIQMSQTYTTALGMYDKQMWILDLPFLFKSHEHAAKVLDGEIGQKIMAGLDRKQIHGLAFTYSGGYRIIPSQNRPLNSMKAFEGEKIGYSKFSPVAKSYLKQLKAVPVAEADLSIATNVKKAQGFETTYARLGGIEGFKDWKYLNETEHTLFLTSIVVNKGFMDSLPEKYQKVIQAAALDVARFERAESIKDNEDTKKQFVEKNNMVVVTLPPKELAKMQEAAKPVYKEFSKELDQNIIAQIQQAGQ